MKRWSKSQLNAISYAYSRKRKEAQRSFIIEKEGSLKEFLSQKKYKSMRGYIANKWGVNL